MNLDDNTEDKEAIADAEKFILSVFAAIALGIYLII
jgi:hypothetical protein